MKRGVLLALLLLTPDAGWAGTNFPALADYPAPACIKPGDKPVMAKGAPKVVPAGGNLNFSTGSRDVKGYNEQVGAYNAALAVYTRCMDAYVDNAQADMNVIRDRANKAVAEGKAP
jgi:hypothetical protein